MAKDVDRSGQVDDVTREDLEQVLIAIIGESLELETSEINPSSRLVGDLDADSLDILDINYQVDRRFGVSLPISDLRKNFEESALPWIDDRGRITEHGLKEVLSLLPEIDDSRIKVGDVIEEVFAVLTVADIVSMLLRKLDSRALQH